MIDSACDMTQKEANELGVLFLPIEVRFGDEEFLDGVTLLPNEFYDRLGGCKELPKTSQINEYRYEEMFRDAVDNGDEVIVITLSSKLSGTYENAIKAGEKFDGKVRVVDSLNAATGERLLGLYALRLINQGLALEQIEEKLNEKKQKIKIFASLDTLKYLKMGGRISPLVAFAGGVISLKPIVGLIDGEVKLVSKAIGNKKSYQAILNIVAQSGEIDPSMPMGYIYSGHKMTALEEFKVNANKVFGEGVKPYILGSTIGTHVGPNAVGVAYFVK